MNPLEFPPNFPACFETLNDYTVWQKSARKCKETITPCDDCTSRHREDMGPMRCQEVVVRETFIVIHRGRRAF